MAIFGRKRSTPPKAFGPQTPRNPPNLDRQRLLALAVGKPRIYLKEAIAAWYDLDTIRLLARPPAPHAGMSLLMALHGGRWTKEEIALEKALQTAKLDLATSIGQSRECLANGEENGHRGLDDLMRDTATSYRRLLLAWEDYVGTKKRDWNEKAGLQIGIVAARALGVACGN